MHLNFLFLSLFFLSSCLTPTPEVRFSQERQKITHKALGNFTRAMRVKGYNAAGIGEGVDHSTGKQNHLSVVFDIDSLPDVEFARRLEVEMLQEFLRCINTQEGIQGYLVEYPFSVRFIEIGFISKHPEEGLFSVANSRNELFYCKNDPEKPNGPLIEIHNESYEDAVKILAEEKMIFSIERNLSKK